MPSRSIHCPRGQEKPWAINRRGKKAVRGGHYVAKPATKKRLPKRYERRIILFLDFLGFKEIVDRTAKDNRELQSLLKAIDKLYAIGRGDADLSKTRSITTFSDSVVLSYAVQEESAVYYLLSDISFAVIELAIEGYLVRGAVTLGKLIHTKRFLVGPAMVKAYELESQVAKVPRVLIDPKLLSIARKAHAGQHTPKHEAGYVRDFMTKDVDGKHYFDYISWKSVVAVVGMDDDGYPLYLKDIANILKRGLANTTPGVLSKYHWIHERYIKAIEQFAKLGPQHRYRINNPEICGAIESLPRMIKEAQTARRAIKGAQSR